MGKQEVSFEKVVRHAGNCPGAHSARNRQTVKILNAVIDLQFRSGSGLGTQTNKYQRKRRNDVNTSAARMQKVMVGTGTRKENTIKTSYKHENRFKLKLFLCRLESKHGLDFKTSARKASETSAYALNLERPSIQPAKQCLCFNHCLNLRDLESRNRGVVQIPDRWLYSKCSDRCAALGARADCIFKNNAPSVIYMKLRVALLSAWSLRSQNTGTEEWFKNK